MTLSDVAPSICAAATETPPLKARRKGLEAGAFAGEVGLAGIDHDLRCVILAGADDQVVDAVAVDIAHGDADRRRRNRRRA